ncbi:MULTISPECIES: flagellar basal body rod protein FlgF [Sphingomonadales]|uniref:Flagellar basal-body rod protein FlgF n=2 Tax=Edaphosphingomonas TaxID=3423724 RepID=A0A2T4I7N6_9SPHN|nr:MULTISPECIES: flagellar basal body rod protein FlgF [Sphingomonas]AGH48930.1 flagellar basal-body rod protein FlgF [Sphingomonas sp. MM-1]OHT21346.1 Flagellar basal-body rod protein FlgF [Sphingomonas haloaromaticamans]PTD27321.1 flagellar basal body rod protein FlgF [Sphingomonas fennica]
MDRLIYSSLSAMRGAMARQATTANNLANANTTGFRAEMASVRPLWIQAAGGRNGGLETRAAASEEVVSADMRGGAVTETGRNLDIALDGDALLAVQAQDGEESYTRRGDLAISPGGLLVTGDGAPVLGETGPITMPPADDIRIDAQGVIWYRAQGADPIQPMQQLDRLKLVSPTGSRIAKGLDGLFRVEGGGALPSDPEARVTAGSLEGSNVNATQALVDMIDASRAWEMQIKLVTTAKELDNSGADLMRLPD